MVWPLLDRYFFFYFIDKRNNKVVLLVLIYFLYRVLSLFPRHNVLKIFATERFQTTIQSTFPWHFVLYTQLHEIFAGGRQSTFYKKKKKKKMWYDCQ